MIIFVLAFILLRTLFALVWDVTIASARRSCNSFANTVFDSLGAESIGQAICEPNGNPATIGYQSESFLILDMGVGNQIIDQQGIDFYYYERFYSPGILLDQVEVAIAQDNGSGNPSSFVVVFVWGDDNPNNNGSIPSGYIPEDANKPINSSDLFNTTGIGINIGNDDGATYRFVRFQTHPTDVIPEEDQVVEVDAIEIVDPPIIITPTPSPSPIETPSSSLIPTVSETPIDLATFTNTPTETSTETLVGETLSSETSTPTITLTPTVTNISTVISTVTKVSAVPPSSTDTSTITSTLNSPLTLTTVSTQTLTVTHAPTVTLTPATETIGTVFTSTVTLINSQTATITPLKTATTTFPSAPTSTPRPIYTLTKTQQPVSGISSTPSPTRMPTGTYTLTPSKTPTSSEISVVNPKKTPIITFTPTITLMPTSTESATDPTDRTSSLPPNTLEIFGIIVAVIALLFAGITGIMPEDQKKKVWGALFSRKQMLKKLDKTPVIKESKKEKPSKASSTKRRRK